jgi:hypothetical protein
MLPLTDRPYLLEKFPGKGGWTFARIPEVLQDPHAHFGWVRVRGSIDGVPIRQYHLMPMGNGQLFLPVKAEIRKKIGKEAGDTVHVVLYADDTPLEIPEDLRLCLEDDPAASRTFSSFSEGEQRAFCDWIQAAKREETRVDRIAVTLRKLALGLKHADRLP